MATLPSIPTVATGSSASADFINSSLAYAVNFLLRPPMCTVYLSANKTITASTWTTVNWDLELVDTDNMHSGSANTLTANTAGYYDLVAHTLLVTTAAQSNLEIRKNAGGSEAGGSRLINVGNIGQTALEAVIQNVPLALNDTVECFVQQQTATSQTLSGTAGFSFFSARLVALT